MSRSVTRTTLIVSVPLLTVAIVAIVGSHPNRSAGASRPTAGLSVALLHPLQPNDLRRMVEDAPPTPAASEASGARPGAVPARPFPVRPALPRPPAPPVAPIGGAAGVEFSLANQDRVANGAASLRFSGALARVAQYRAQDMLNRNYFSHYDPATGQLAFVALMHLWGIPYSSAGENIAWSTNPSMAGINTMFMNSPEHRANILNGGYHQAGIGVASNGVKTMVVEVFSN
ncbi:MAG TPA: CAP domain-containing protein [Candidatus Dormibacteraeota bacterium]|nr:CAP domain-containing protein [Candidatus Dormibacteraeota bacterium]